MRVAAFAALVAAMALGGCASVVRGTSEQVQFDSDPPGAEMRSIIDYPCGGPCPDTARNGEYRTAAEMRTPPVPGPACVTPCMAQVARNQDLIVTFTKPGYEPQTVPLKRVVTGAGAMGVAGNVLIGGVIGGVVDTATGAATDHAPNPLKVTLRAIPAPRPATSENKRKRKNTPANHHQAAS